jgi:hypothetical protein
MGHREDFIRDDFDNQTVKCLGNLMDLMMVLILGYGTESVAEVQGNSAIPTDAALEVNRRAFGAISAPATMRAIEVARAVGMFGFFEETDINLDTGDHEVSQFIYLTPKGFDSWCENARVCLEEDYFEKLIGNTELIKTENIDRQVKNLRHIYSLPHGKRKGA